MTSTTRPNSFASVGINVWTCALVLGALSALTLVLASSEEAAAAEQPPRQQQARATPPIAHTVVRREIDDLKAVMATVRSKKVIKARVRTPGTVATLSVTEGDHVEQGQVVGLVTDTQLAIRIKAFDARIAALNSRLSTAKSELERTTQLNKRGVSPQARLDQAKTAFDVASNEFAAVKAERDVVRRQAEEGQVLAPASGRILRVSVTEGSVVMSGETIATIAANEYLLRLEVPERHARFIRKGDQLKVGPRGLGPHEQQTRQGRIMQVYPEIKSGRVIADAEVTGLGNYFVGERTLVWISAGKRKTIIVPRDLVFKRFGLDFVRVEQAAHTHDIVVQLGQSTNDGEGGAFIEVLSGLKVGDRLVRP